MKEVSQSRHKKLEKISFEEVMGAAGMSGFGALLERRPASEEPAWQPVAELRLKFLLKGAALVEKLGRQNDMLRSLNEPLTRRVISLAQALGILSRITCARTYSLGTTGSKTRKLNDLIFSTWCDFVRPRRPRESH